MWCGIRRHGRRRGDICQLQQAQVQAFTTALSEMSAPVLAFCRTGTRSSTLGALQAPGTADAILASASAAGYDLSALRRRLGDADAGPLTTLLFS